MFTSPLSLIADLTLSSFYLPGRQSGCLKVQQPSFNHEAQRQKLSVLEEEDRSLDLG